MNTSSRHTIAHTLALTLLLSTLSTSALALSPEELIELHSKKASSLKLKAAINTATPAERIKLRAARDKLKEAGLSKQVLAYIDVSVVADQKRALQKRLDGENSAPDNLEHARHDFGPLAAKTFPNLTECVRAAGDNKGTLLLRVRFKKSGKVKSVKVRKDSLESKKARRCFVRKLKKSWRLARQDGILQIDYPINLPAKPGSPLYREQKPQ